MNIYQLHVANEKETYDTWEVHGNDVWHAMERMRTIHQVHGRVIGFRLIKENEHEQRHTAETKPSRNTMR